MDMPTDLAKHHGTTVTPEIIDYARGLYEWAFDANSSPKHAAQIIEQQLADADHVSRRSSVRGASWTKPCWIASTASPTWKYASTRWRRRLPPSASQHGGHGEQVIEPVVDRQPKGVERIATKSGGIASP